jgi:hypothetical protein
LRTFNELAEGALHMTLWNRLFRGARPEVGSQPRDLLTYHGVDFVLPPGFSGVVGQESAQQVPVAMIGPKAEDQFDRCLIQLRCVDVGGGVADGDLITSLSQYGGSNPEPEVAGPWRGFRAGATKHESGGQTQWLRMLLVWERRLLIVEYSAPLEWFDVYRAPLLEMLASAKPSAPTATA